VTREHQALDVRERIQACGVIPVVAIGRAEDAVALGAALAEAGLPTAEVTLRTPAGLDAIRRMRSADPAMLIGAGTVLTPGQAAGAIEAGAQYIVMPGFRDDVVAMCRDSAVPVYPGVVTPTEVMRALDAGITDVKFFPAESAGGLAHLRALAGPFPMMRFIPTGGISLANLASYLGDRSVLAVGGSWMVKADLLEARDWASVRSLAAEAAAAVAAIRAGSGA
jgi:2-dehydro-3-deoxyphosphogluconate aldolase / (4S)-4-hydroxy-2-oxoglutarate aldolase